MNSLFLVIGYLNCCEWRFALPHRPKRQQIAQLSAEVKDDNPYRFASVCIAVLCSFDIVHYLMSTPYSRHLAPACLLPLFPFALAYSRLMALKRMGVVQNYEVNGNSPIVSGFFVFHILANDALYV